MHTLSFKVSLRLFFPGVFPAALSVAFITAVVITIIVILVFVAGSGIHTVFPAAVFLAFIGLIPCIFLRLSLISRCLGTISAPVLPC